MSNKTTLLFITTELPWPADSGGKIKTFRFIQYLTAHFDVQLICAQGGEKVAEIQALRKAVPLKSVQAFQNYKKRSAWNWLTGLMSFPTFNAFRVFSKPLESMLRWGVEKTDVVIVDHLEMMEMIPENLVPKVIYHSHNAEFKLWKDFAKLEMNPIKKGALEWEADRVMVFERWAINKSKFTFAAPNDQKELEQTVKLVPDKFRLTFHLGNESLLEFPEIHFSANAHRIFYAGTLSWMPNRDGLVWFLRNCWSQIRSKVPDAELVVCGKGADSELSQLMRQTEGVDYKGFVDDINQEMEKCRMAIVPLRFGSGMKIKTFDALYRALPLVVTSIGAEGIELVAGKHAFISDAEIEFSDAVVSLLQDDALSKSMADAGRKFVAENYTYPKIFESMLADLLA